eukprot:13608502-Heterocapsa_arctica.AAC.1
MVIYWKEGGQEQPDYYIASASWPCKYSGCHAMPPRRGTDKHASAINRLVQACELLRRVPAGDNALLSARTPP